LAAAEAARDAATAQLERARLDLQRTQIIAPYKGMVSEKAVNTGQFVARGAAVGQIYSIASVDVVLPLSNRQLTHLQVPSSSVKTQAAVKLQALVGSTRYEWDGKLIRTAGIDSTTQQLTLVAQVQNPMTQSDVPLRVGQFVEAQIQGSVLEQVFVIPRSSLREEREVLLVDEEKKLRRQAVVIAWSDDQVVAIEQGLEAGSLLVTTPLSTVSEGTPVRATVDGVPPKAPPEKDKPARAEKAIN
jgi:RND family efflux transporter MFP subunit